MFLHIPPRILFLLSAYEETDWNPLLYFAKVTTHAFREDNIMVDNGGLHGWTRTLKQNNKTTQLFLVPT